MGNVPGKVVTDQPDNAADRDQKIKAVDELRQEMEALALKARDLILAQPPIQFLGYVLSQFHLAMLQVNIDAAESSHHQKEVVKIYQLVLEYMHAVWSCHADLPNEAQPVDEGKAGELMEVFAALDVKTALYCMASTAARIDDGAGGHSAETEFHAKSSWSLIRGHRYQVLEGEFFRFALEPHSDALKSAYGVDHDEIAAGIQRIADAFRAGVSRAADELNAAMQRADAITKASGEDLETIMTRLRAEEPEYTEEIGQQIQDMLFGGVCNLSRHSGLPAALLVDLSYAPGENTHFLPPASLQARLCEHCQRVVNQGSGLVVPSTRLTASLFETLPIVRSSGDYGSGCHTATSGLTGRVVASKKPTRRYSRTSSNRPNRTRAFTTRMRPRASGSSATCCCWLMTSYWSSKVRLG